jgi:glycosyltransferase involved in cell wall biosynthesis
MRIAQIANIAERVPPKKYGGTERVIYTLTEELVRKGHDVTLFASGDSITSAKLSSVFPMGLREAKVKDLYGYNIPSLLNMASAYARHKEFDIIHDHNPTMGLPVAHVISTPTVMTWHGPYSDDVITYFSKLDKPKFVSISNSQAKDALNMVNFAGTVYNGLNMADYPFSAEHEGYLLYVGRISKEKGVHVAIEVAAKLQIPLVIAAKLDRIVPADMQYFYNHITPRLKKYAGLVKWIGEVDEAERNKLMSRAMCFLHPVFFAEPFGLTLIESMACGCPVVAFNKGAIPEVVSDGKTGFVVSYFDDMVESIKKINTIDRKYCREYSLTTFSGARMAAGYETIYKKIINGEYKK